MLGYWILGVIASIFSFFVIVMSKATKQSHAFIIEPLIVKYYLENYD